MNKVPGVSVCIPVYNNAAGLERALKSVASQSFQDYEVIITDDSTDDSAELVADLFKGAMPELTYYRNKERAGSPGNWNRALELAKGKYIKIIHHDDWLKTHGCLAEMVSAAEKTDGLVLVFSSSSAVNPQMDQVGINRPKSSSVRNVSEMPISLLQGNIIGAPSATLFSNHGGLRFDENLIWLVDVDFYIAAMKKGYRLKYLDKVLVCTTTGSSQQITSAVENSKEIELYETTYLIDKWQSNSHKTNYLQLTALLDKYGVKTLRSLKGINFSPRQKWTIRRLLLLNNARRIIRRFT